MNSPLILHISRFLVLVLLQVVLFNNINFLGYINPLVYILFVILYPIKEKRAPFLITAFFLGLCIDIFSDSGGINAAACVTIAYVRPLILRLSFGNNYEFQATVISKTPIAQQLTYVALLILIHHLVLFSLDFFSFTHTLAIIKKTLATGLFTLVLCMIIISLFSTKK
jgi:rod shape-determining protein MreD